MPSLRTVQATETVSPAVAVGGAEAAVTARSGETTFVAAAAARLSASAPASNTPLKASVTTTARHAPSAMSGRLKVALPP